MSADIPLTPEPWGHALWVHLHREHGCTLLESEIAEIIRIAKSIETEPNGGPESEFAAVTQQRDQLRSEQQQALEYVDQAKRERDQARADLATFGRHLWKCKVRLTDAGMVGCTCGFDAALEANK